MIAVLCIVVVILILYVAWLHLMVKSACRVVDEVLEDNRKRILKCLDALDKWQKDWEEEFRK